MTSQILKPFYDVIIKCETDFSAKLKAGAC